MGRRLWIVSIVLFGGLAAVSPLQASHHEIMVTIENLAPEGGVFFTPVWVGLHDGSVDLFDPGGLASEGLERLAEDGDASTLRADFEATAGAAGMDTVVTAPSGFEGAPVFDPGDMATVRLTAVPEVGRYLSFAAMIIPSNDAFIGNHNPKAIELFDAAGNFKGKQIVTVLGSMVWDAGTELNTEMDAAFINQTDPDTGVTTMSPVLPHPGFLGSYGNPGSNPIILGGTGPGGIVFDPIAADFTLPYAVVARITIEPAPAEATIAAASKPNPLPGRGNGALGTVYVTSQGLYYDTFVSADTLPFKGRFQRLVNGMTEFGPGQPGYLGGRWWVDDGDGIMEPPEGGEDAYLLCPLLPPGRSNP